MVDWNGLFKWSMEHQDGTRPTEFKVMSAEDRKWLEEAMKQFTFNDVDRLKELSQEIKGHMQLEEGKLIDLLDELLEILELHNRNSLNLCVSGGMEAIMEIIFKSPYAKARQDACGIFSFTNQNNIDVQKITFKLGALNMMQQYVIETNIKNREGVISALSSFLRGINTEGKRAFLTQFSGLDFLKRALADAQALQQDGIRLGKKIVMLLLDFAQNDELVNHEGKPDFIRRNLYEDSEFIITLSRYLSAAQLTDYQSHDLREHALLLLSVLVQVFEIKDEIFIESLSKLEKQIKEHTEANPSQEFNEMLQKELSLIAEILDPKKSEPVEQQEGGAGQEQSPVLAIKM